MTRRSKREIERAVDELASDATTDDRVREYEFDAETERRIGEVCAPDTETPEWFTETLQEVRERDGAEE